MRRRRGDDPKDREPPTFYGPIHHGGSFDMVHHNDTTRREFAASMEEQIASLPPKDAPVVTVIVPVYNEARTIGELLRRVDASPYSKQITVVDDGSNDETSHVLDSFKGENRVEVLRHPANRGKGGPRSARHWNTRVRRSPSFRTPTWSTTRRTTLCSSNRSGLAKRRRCSAHAITAPGTGVAAH